MVDAVQFEVEKVSAKQLANGDWQLTVKVHPNDFHESIMKMAPGERMVVAAVAVDHNDQIVKPENVAKTNGRRYFTELPAAQQAALACQRTDFQEWLSVSSEKLAAEKVRGMTQVKSRSELNQLPEVWNRIWDKFKADYNID